MTYIWVFQIKVKILLIFNHTKRKNVTNSLSVGPECPIFHCPLRCVQRLARAPISTCKCFFTHLVVIVMFISNVTNTKADTSSANYYLVKALTMVHASKFPCNSFIIFILTIVPQS